MNEELQKNNEAVIREMLKAWESLDVDAIMAFMSDDVIAQFHEGAPESQGKDALNTEFSTLFDGCKLCKIEVKDCYSNGAVVVTQRDDRMDLVKDGKPTNFRFECTGVYRLKDGKICSWRDTAFPGGILKMK